MSARTDLPNESLPASRIKKHGRHRIPAIIFALVMALSVCLLCSGCGASSQAKSSSSKSDSYKQETFHDISFSIPKELKSTDHPESDSIMYDLGETAKNPFAASLHIQVFPDNALTAQDICDAYFGDYELVSANGIEMCWNPNAYSGSNMVACELTIPYNGSLYMVNIDYMTDYKPSYKEFAENFYKSIKPAGTDDGASATSESSKQSESSSTPPKAKITPGNALEWSSASQHVGETVTIYGPVVGAEYASASSGKPTFIDIGATYPNDNRVTMTIWGKNRSAFSPSPESMYQGKTVCVTGQIYLYKGVCNIEVTSPAQVEIL